MKAPPPPVRIDTDRALDRLVYIADLTRAETKVARLLLAGHSNAKIAALLKRKEGTIKRHVASIIAKADIPSRFGLWPRLIEDGRLSP